MMRIQCQLPSSWQFKGAPSTVEIDVENGGNVHSALEIVARMLDSSLYGSIFDPQGNLVTMVARNGELVNEKAELMEGDHIRIVKSVAGG